jgi:hypothetical protein
MATESIQQHGIATYLPLPHNVSKNTISVNEVEILPEETSLSTFGFLSTPTFIDPQIHVAGHKLQLPLSEEDARLCIHVGHQSSRRTWQLNTTDFEIRSPEWSKYLNLMVGEVAKSMGLSCEKPGFHAELCNMRLYEREAVVEAYKAAETVPGTFATMTVRLPSVHTGAAVRIDGEQLAQLPTPTVPHSSLVWWEAENSYEMLPVESGIRWELTFNLVLDNKSRL